MVTARSLRNTTRLTSGSSAIRLEQSGGVPAGAAPLQLGAGGLLSLSLALAPLDYGSTRPAGVWLLVALLGGAGLCWAASCVLARRVPPLPPLVWLGLGALGISLWPWLAGIATPTLPAEFTRGQLARVMARWPRSVIAPDPGEVLALHAGLGLALAIAADLARDRRWLLTFSLVVVLTASLVTVLALTQNFTTAPGIFWEAGERMPGRFWGTFFHHTAAGAYLNTAWPLAAGLALAARRGSVRLLAAAVLATVLLLGAHASHVSRFPQLAAAAVAMLLIARFHLLRTARRRVQVAALLAVVALLAVGTGRLADIGARWREFGAHRAHAMQPVPPESAWPQLVRDDLLIPNVYNGSAWGDRGEAQRTALRAIAARPWWGHGPANWAAAASVASSDPYVRSFYLHLQFAHADFLQAAAELGLPALLGLLLLLPLGVAAGFASAGRLATDPLAPTLAFCASAALGAVLVQSLADFPLQIPAVALNAHVLAGLAWSAWSSAPSQT